MTDAHGATVGSAQSADDSELRRLNGEYIRAFVEADVDWYDRHLAEAYTCTLGRAGS
jgi:hypothetical protein